MIIYVLEDASGITDLVDVFASVIWNMQFYGPGDFELVVPATDKNINTLKDCLMALIFASISMRTI